MLNLNQFILLIVLIPLLAACSGGEKKLTKNQNVLAGMMCRSLAEGHVRGSEEEGGNQMDRDYLNFCVEERHIHHQKTLAEVIDNPETINPNSLAVSMEEHNLWYYTEDENGHQKAAINLYNPENTEVSWVIVGFYKDRCGEENENTVFMRLPIPEPLLRKDQTVLTWDVPENVSLSEGCMDIWEAG